MDTSFQTAADRASHTTRKRNTTEFHQAAAPAADSLRTTLSATAVLGVTAARGERNGTDAKVRTLEAELEKFKAQPQTGPGLDKTATQRTVAAKTPEPESEPEPEPESKSKPNVAPRPSPGTGPPPPGPPRPPMNGGKKQKVVLYDTRKGNPEKKPGCAMVEFHGVIMRQAVLDDSVWAHMQYPIVELETEPLEKMFHVPEKKSASKKPIKQTGETFLNQQDQQNIAIKLTTMKLQTTDQLPTKADVIAAALMAMDPMLLCPREAQTDQEQAEQVIEKLKGCVPTETWIKDWKAQPDVVLQDTDAFLSQLMEIPQLSERLDCLALQLVWGQTVFGMTQHITAKQAAVDAVFDALGYTGPKAAAVTHKQGAPADPVATASLPLVYMLTTALDVANFVNSGKASTKKHSNGFNLDSLLKLAETKSPTDRKYTLREFKLHLNAHRDDPLAIALYCT